MRIIVLLSHSQSSVNALHFVIALNYFTLACNVISVLVEMVNFAMVKVDNFCKIKMIAVYFKVFDRNYARIVVSKSERLTNLSIWVFNDVVIVKNKEVVF